MIYMVAGYLIIWAASFVFIVSMVQRQRNLRREIESLQEVAGEDNTAAGGAPEYSPSASLR
jgi:CcmD family protein